MEGSRTLKLYITLILSLIWQTLSRDTTLTASNGKKVPAIHVFSCALRYFRDHALQELSDQSATKILNEDIRWVITVPAIWKQPAKQFMRQAAYEVTHEVLVA